jgi:hypothetical protein
VKATVSTWEAAQLLGVDPRSFHRWAAERDIQPVRRQRIGRSWVTVWSVGAIRAAQQQRFAGQAMIMRAELTTLAVECLTSGPAEVS